MHFPNLRNDLGNGRPRRERSTFPASRNTLVPKVINENLWHFLAVLVSAPFLCFPCVCECNLSVHEKSSALFAHITSKGSSITSATVFFTSMCQAKCLPWLHPQKPGCATRGNYFNSFRSFVWVGESFFFSAAPHNCPTTTVSVRFPVDREPRIPSPSSTTMGVPKRFNWKERTQDKKKPDEMWLKTKVLPLFTWVIMRRSFKRMLCWLAEITLNELNHVLEGRKQ